MDVFSKGLKGVARQAGLGTARTVRVWLGKDWRGKAGMVRKGLAR